MSIRFPIDPLMVPETKVARRLGITVKRLVECRPALEARGFPGADPILGTTCLEAVDNWIAEKSGLKSASNSFSPADQMKQAVSEEAWRQ